MDSNCIFAIVAKVSVMNYLNIIICRILFMSRPKSVIRRDSSFGDNNGENLSLVSTTGGGSTIESPNCGGQPSSTTTYCMGDLSQLASSCLVDDHQEIQRAKEKAAIIDTVCCFK